MLPCCHLHIVPITVAAFKVSSSFGPLRIRADACYVKVFDVRVEEILLKISSLTLRCVIVQAIFDISWSSSVSSWIASPWRWWQYRSSKGRQLFTNRHGVTHSRDSNIQQLRNENLTKTPRDVAIPEIVGLFLKNGPWWLPTESLRIHHRIFHAMCSYVISVAGRSCRVIPSFLSFRIF
jgi:hypothetical protein